MTMKHNILSGLIHSHLKAAIDNAQQADNYANELHASVLAKNRRLTRELLQHRADANRFAGTGKPSVHRVYTPDSVRAVAIEKALHEWRSIVMEPPGDNWECIDTYIRGDLGLGWSSADANDLSNPVGYTRNRQFAWCGAFCAHCWGVAGLKAAIRKEHIASLRRLWHFADETPRFIGPEDILAGDVVAMGEVDGPKYGQHMGLAVADFKDDSIVCIEGNAHGDGPDGTRYEGVVQNKRPLLGFSDTDKSVYYVRYGVRFLEDDLEQQS